MEDDRTRDEEQDVNAWSPGSSFLDSHQEDEPVEAPEEVVLESEEPEEEELVLVDVPDRIAETVRSAGFDWTIKVKSAEDFNSLSQSLKLSNPKRLKVVLKPSLGHHSIAVK